MSGGLVTGADLALRLRRSQSHRSRLAAAVVAGALGGFARGRRRTWWVFVWCFGAREKCRQMTCGDGRGGAQSTLHGMYYIFMFTQFWISFPLKYEGDDYVAYNEILSLDQIVVNSVAFK